MSETNEENADRAQPPFRHISDNSRVPSQQSISRQRLLRMNANSRNGNDNAHGQDRSNSNNQGSLPVENRGHMFIDATNDNQNMYSDEDYDYMENSGNLNGWSVAEVVDGTPPASRSLHAAAILNDVFYCFGGYDGVARVNTFHAFSFAEKRWSPVLPSANSAGPPSPRDRHVAVAFGNSFYVHGGFDGTSRVSDFWLFDLSSMCWREVVVLDGRPPSPRHSHSAVVHSHSLYIYGGYDGSYSRLPRLC